MYSAIAPVVTPQMELDELATCRLPATYESHKQTDASFGLTIPTYKVDTFNILCDQQQAVILKACYLGLTVFLYCSVDPTLKFGCAFFIHHVYITTEICVGHCASWWATQAA